MNGIYSCDGAPPFPTFGRLPVAFQGAYITPYMVSVGAPAAYPRLLKGDGFTVLPRMTTTTTVLPRMTTTPKRNPTATRPQRGHPLNSRGSERPADSKRKGKCTPAGCPTTQMGDPSRVDIPSTILPGVLRTPRLLRGDGFTVLPRMTTTTTVLPRMTTTTTTQRSQRDTLRATHAQPDRNAVTLSIAVGSQNLRIGRKGKRETTLKGSPNTANGAPHQGDKEPSTHLF